MRALGQAEKRGGTVANRGGRVKLAPGLRLKWLKCTPGEHVAYYTSVGGVSYPDDSGRRGELRLSPAILAGILDTLWDFHRAFGEATSCRWLPM